MLHLTLLLFFYIFGSQLFHMSVMSEFSVVYLFFFNLVPIVSLCEQGNMETRFVCYYLFIVDRQLVHVSVLRALRTTRLLLGIIVAP